MSSLTHRRSLFIIQLVLLCLNVCLGEIKLCANHGQHLQNGSSLFAKKGTALTVSFCVYSDYDIHMDVMINHNHIDNWYRNEKTKNRICVLINGERSNATINITINQIEDRDYGDFYISVYNHIKFPERLKDKVIFWFQLKKYDASITTELPWKSTSELLSGSLDITQEDMFLYLYIAVPGVIVAAIIAITAILVYRHKVNCRGSNEIDKSAQSIPGESKEKVKAQNSESRLSAKVHCQESGHTMHDECLLYTTISQHASQENTSQSQDKNKIGHLVSEEGLVYTTIAKQTSQVVMNPLQSRHELDRILSEEGHAYTTIAKQTSQVTIKLSQTQQESDHIVTVECPIYTSVAKIRSHDEMKPQPAKKESETIVSDEGLVYTTIVPQKIQGKATEIQGRK